MKTLSETKQREFFIIVWDCFIINMELPRSRKEKFQPRWNRNIQMQNYEICPHCHGRNFVLAQQTADGTLACQEIVTLEPGRLYHLVCLGCGTIVRTFVEDPAQLLSTEDSPREISFCTPEKADEV